MIGGCLGSKVDPGPSAERSDQMRRSCLRKPSASAAVGVYSSGFAISMRRICLSFSGIYQMLQTCQPYIVRLCLHPQQIRMSPLARKPNLARHLRDARIKRGLSVAEVAEQVGVSQSSIYFWETDHCRPRDANLSALCKVLKLPIRATREMAA